MKLYSDRPCIAFSSGPASHLRESSSSSPSAMSSSSLKVSSLSRPGSQVASLGASQTMARSYAMSLKSSLATAKAPATTTTTIPVDKENGHQHLPPPLSRASLSTDKVSLRDITANDDVDECYQEEDDDDLEEEVHSLYDHHSSPHHHHLLRDRNGASTADKGNVSSGLLVGASSAPPPLSLISGAQSSLEYAPGVKAKQMSVASSVHALLNGGQEKGKKTKTNTSTVGTKSGVLGDSSGAHSSGSSSGTSSRSGSSTDIDALVDDGLSSLGSSALSSSASSPPPPPPLQHEHTPTIQADAASASVQSEGNPIVDVAKAASSPKGTATAAASSVGQSCQQTTAAVTVTSSSARRLSPSSLAIASSGLLVSSSSSTSSSAYSLDSSSYSDFPYSASSSSSSTAPSPPLTSHHSPNSQHHQHRVGHLPQQQQQQQQHQASYHCTTPKPSAHHSSHFNQLRQQQQLHSVSGPLANLLPYSGYQHAYQLQPSYEGSVPQTAFGRMTFAEPLTYGHHPQLMGASSAERRRHSTHLNFAFNHETAVNHGDGHRVSGGQQQQRHRQAIYPNAASQQQQQQQQHASLSLSCLAGVKDQLELLTLSVQQQQEEQDANNNCIERPRRDTLNNSLTSGPFVSSTGDLVHEETLTNGGACLTFTPPLSFTSEKEDSSTQAVSGPMWQSQHSKQQQQLMLPQQQPQQPKQKSRVPSQSQSPSSYYPSLSSLIAERKSAWLDGPLSDLILKTYTHRRQPKTLLEYKCTLQEAITRSLTAHLRAPDGSPLSFKLYLIGSSLTSIGSLHSDIDLCMVLYNPKTGTVDESYHNRLIAETMLSRMSAILEKAGLAYQCKVIRANVPILKFFDQNHIEVNINLNKLVTVQNTMLLVRLCALDARVAPFLFTVKLWAAKNGINCAYFKSLSSYSLSLMAIFYLQSIARPALLPPFSDLVEDVLRSTSLFASNQTVEESAWGRDGGLHVTSSGPFFAPAPALSLLEQLAIPPPPPPPPPVFEETASAEEAYQNSKPPKMPAGSAISKVTFLDPTPPVCQTQPPPPLQSKKAKKKAALLAATQQQQAAAAVATALATGDLSAFADLGLAQLGQATLESKNLPYYYTYYYYYYTYQMGLLSAQMAQQQQQAQASQVAATVSALANFKSPNTHSLGRLFSDFITFYSDRSVYDSVISVRSGRLMKRTDPLFARSFETCMDTFICIEEPFNHSNTSHSVHNDFMFNFIVKSFNWTRDSIAKMKLTLNDFV